MVICTLLQWWCLVVVAAYLVTTKTQFDVVAVRAGTGLGAVQSASRVLMAGLIPPGREAELFAFYAPGGEDVGDSRPADLWGWHASRAGTSGWPFWPWGDVRGRVRAHRSGTGRRPPTTGGRPDHRRPGRAPRPWGAGTRPPGVTAPISALTP